MVDGKLFAVLTGDLVGSSRFEIETKRDDVLSVLKDSFKKVESPGIIASHFAIHRGDSFQGVLSRPEEALKTAIMIRTNLLSNPIEKNIRLDARIAIGLGKIEYLPRDKVGEGDGEAFRNSGMELDRMKKGERNLTIKTPWPETDKELQTECALLNALSHRWTREQAEAIMYQVQGYTQDEIAKQLKISQSAVFQRLRTGGSWAVQALLERFKEIIQYKAMNL
ncbi:MAG: SatD family protein [ANME-2 cluster archaeon]|nr:SatD family protein [ANME-2 cluster archaeon]MDF1531830.1 SatD family protein [ANME-2 cluster archaeon]